jgi:PTS system N-acetylglucosamine-specific IIC component
MALTSFLTGVTEPVEFTFMFLAPALYAVHAALTGAAMVTMALLDVHLGFSFSAGLFDYVLNFNKATHPWLLLPVGAAYFGIYYATFRWCILRFGLRTPGRDVEQKPASAPAKAPAAGAGAYVEALGGARNLRSVDACTTRLRLVLANREKVNEAALRQLGAMGMVKIGHDGLQVVVGPVADQLAGEIRGALNMDAGGASASAASEPRSGGTGETARPELLAALGGSANVRNVEFRGGRLLAELADAGRVDEAELRDLGVRAVARLASGSVHLLCADPSALVLSPAP